LEGDVDRLESPLDQRSSNFSQYFCRQVLGRASLWKVTLSRACPGQVERTWPQGSL